MTNKNVGTILGLPISTWITMAAFFVTLLAGGAKFYASDELQTANIVSIEQRVQSIEANNSDTLKLLSDIRERIVRIETKLEK